jgi:hypothetical protein
MIMYRFLKAIYEKKPQAYLKGNSEFFPESCVGYIQFHACEQIGSCSDIFALMVMLLNFFWQNIRNM